MHEPLKTHEVITRAEQYAFEDAYLKTRDEVEEHRPNLEDCYGKENADLIIEALKDILPPS